MYVFRVLRQKVLFFVADDSCPLVVVFLRLCVAGTDVGTVCIDLMNVAASNFLTLVPGSGGVEAGMEDSRFFFRSRCLPIES